MSRALQSWASAALLLVAVPILPSRAEADTNVTVTVVADQTKQDGSPWDGTRKAGLLGAAAGLAGDLLESPPDLMLCVVRLTGEPDCIFRRDTQALRRFCQPGLDCGIAYSLCQDSFECEFPSVAIPAEPFGFLVVDIDPIESDPVDGVILARTVLPDGAPERQQLDARLKQLLDRISPPLLPQQRWRRQQPFAAHALADCRPAAPCRLRQSTLAIAE